MSGTARDGDGAAPARADAELLFERQGTTGVITFNRPGALNALTFAMYDRVGEICATLPTDGSVRALILTGAGDRAFAAGTDISLFRQFSSAADGLAYEARMERALDKLERCRVPTIAAICGVCTGGAAAGVIGRCRSTPRLGYRPRKLGVRLERNASTPSWKSVLP